jgi:hypothetical protein
MQKAASAGRRGESRKQKNSRGRRRWNGDARSQRRFSIVIQPGAPHFRIARDPARMIEGLRIPKAQYYVPNPVWSEKSIRHDFARAGHGDRMIKSATCRAYPHDGASQRL